MFSHVHKGCDFSEFLFGFHTNQNNDADDALKEPQIQNIAYPSRKHTYIILTPLNPTFYSKTGVNRGIHCFLISVQNIDFGYSLEPPRRGGSNGYPQSMFLSRNVKNIRIFICKLSVCGCEISNIFE